MVAKKEKAISQRIYKEYLSEKAGESSEEILTREYQIFAAKKTRATMIYEKLCQFSGKIYKQKNCYKGRG